MSEPESRVRGNAQARFGEGRQEKVRKEPRLPSTLQHPDEVPCSARATHGRFRVVCGGFHRNRNGVEDV